MGWIKGDKGYETLVDVQVWWEGLGSAEEGESRQQW